MADQDNVVAEEPSHLGMSDADFMAAPPPSFETTEVVAEEKEETPVAEAVVEEEKESTEAEVTDDEEGNKPSEEVVADDEGVKQDEVKEEKEEKVEKPKKEAPQETTETKAIDFEAEYKRILAPFKANGREVSVNSVDDAIQLMQMGANYNKRMAALKPNLKLMRMLENNGLLDEGKLSYLIDLDKKNPEAITKLVKESGIDPMSIDTEKADAYKQSTYNVHDAEIELDTVLDELQTSPAYTQTLDIVSTKWDGASKQVIATTPQLLKFINHHVETGVYDVISKKVESERMFGRLTGMSDIDAYRQVGEMIQAEGGFNHLNKGSSPVQKKPATPAVVVPPKPSKVDEDKLKEKRRAASSTKPTGPVTKPDYNPLSMPDAEFLKMATKIV